jgi:hypothetical protein
MVGVGVGVSDILAVEAGCRVGVLVDAVNPLPTGVMMIGL